MLGSQVFACVDMGKHFFVKVVGKILHTKLIYSGLLVEGTVEPYGYISRSYRTVFAKHIMDVDAMVEALRSGDNFSRIGQSRILDYKYVVCEF